MSIKQIKRKKELEVRKEKSVDFKELLKNVSNIEFQKILKETLSYEEKFEKKEISIEEYHKKIKEFQEKVKTLKKQ